MMERTGPRALPTGVVAFLMSDVEASGRHWAAGPGTMATALRELDALIATASADHGGVVLKTRGEGDSHFAVFARPSDAVRAACRVQVATTARSPGHLGLRVRIGVHTGEAEPAVDDYYGVVVNQTARLRGAAHGGQTVLSSPTAALARPGLPPEVHVKSLGHHRIRDLPGLQEVFQASTPGADDVFPPLRTGETSGPAVLAVVLVDVCGTTRHIGPSSGVDVIEWQRQLAADFRRVAEPLQPTVLRRLGDGCLAAFDDPVRAIGFLHEVRSAAAETGLQVRCGIEVGRVELDDGDVIGPAVFTAAELCRRAGPDQILGSATVADLAGPRSEAVSSGRATLLTTGKEIEVVSL